VVAFTCGILSSNINLPQEDVLLENKTELGVSAITPGTTFANDYHWRSTKAKQQLRDRFGRWISLGANVRFQANGKEQSGIVTSVIDGKAYVDMKNLDGTVTQQILSPSDMRVIASKATLPPDGTKVNDPGNNFAKAMQTPEYQKALAEHGQAVIARADGFSLAANQNVAAEAHDVAQGGENKALDGTEDHKDKVGGNPIMYQLFAPGGRSLGQYGEAGSGDFDAMVADYKASSGQSADVDPSGDGTPEAPKTATVTASGEEKPFRVPDAVKEEIRNTLNSFSSEMPEADLAVANRLATDATVSRADVEWVHGYFCENDLSERLRGGYKGRKWASKIIGPDEPQDFPDEAYGLDDGHPKYSFDDDTFAYFAVGKVAGSTLVYTLLSVDYETGAVYSWTPEGFALQEGVDMAEVDEPQIIPIDEMTADEFAHWIDSGVAEEFDILDTDTDERNLFSLAASELDFESLDRAYSIIAAGPTDGVYTPVERSQNAKVQARAQGGRFGSQPDKPKPAEPVDMAKPQAPASDPAADPAAQGDGDGGPKVKKATLPEELPLVENPAQRISEWLSTAAEAPVVAAGEPETDSAYTEQDQAAEDAATGPTDEALYFAIVDPVDKTAVLDAIAIVKSNGQPATFIRKDGAWAADPDTLTILQGATPPPVVELADPATVKSVLEQIDTHDAEAGKDDPAQPAPAAVAASGFAMPDGSYTIIDVEDLKEAVVASAGTSDIFVKAHVRKRARALNRMDVVPADWREVSLAESGELSAARTVYGEFGEIIVASAGKRGHGSEAQLRAYWTRGKGALKIRWGTKGDLTRAHRHLSKYVGPERAWGLAQSYHRDLFGVYNYTHDVATGQYVHHGKK
jgi:hypothetical protein